RQLVAKVRRAANAAGYDRAVRAEQSAARLAVAECPVDDCLDQRPWWFRSRLCYLVALSGLPWLGTRFAAWLGKSANPAALRLDPRGRGARDVSQSVWTRFARVAA